MGGLASGQEKTGTTFKPRSGIWRRKILRHMKMNMMTMMRIKVDNMIRCLVIFLLMYAPNLKPVHGKLSFIVIHTYIWGDRKIRAKMLWDFKCFVFVGF